MLLSLLRNMAKVKALAIGKIPPEKIPRKKPRKRGKDSQDASTLKGPTGRHCARCAQWSPPTCKLHNTSECRRWTEDGEKIPRKSEASKELKSLKRNFSTLLKQQRKLHKSIKKTHKKIKKKKKDDSSSSSDSSDSE